MSAGEPMSISRWGSTGCGLDPCLYPLVAKVVIRRIHGGERDGFEKFMSKEVSEQFYLGDPEQS